MSFSYALAEHGSTLATRPLGSRLRADLIQRADEAEVVLDFSDILSTSHSFADEFVARLAEEIEFGEIDFKATVTGASAEVERVVRKALERRNVELPVAHR